MNNSAFLRSANQKKLRLQKQVFFSVLEHLLLPTNHLNYLYIMAFVEKPLRDVNLVDDTMMLILLHSPAKRL